MSDKNYQRQQQNNLCFIGYEEPPKFEPLKFEPFDSISSYKPSDENIFGDDHDKINIRSNASG